jgi:hypothetical protein
VGANQKACSIKGTKKLWRSGHTLQATLALIARWMRQRSFVIEQPRRYRACQTSLQGSEIEPWAPMASASQHPDLVRI